MAEPTSRTGPEGGASRSLTWDLERLYPSLESWRRHLEDLVARVDTFAAGGPPEDLAGEPARLQERLRESFEIEKELGRLVVYASQRYDEDQRVPSHHELMEEASRLEAVFLETRRLFGRGLARLDESSLEAPELALYRPFLERQRRVHPGAPRPDAERDALARLAGAPERLFDLLVDDELPGEEVELSTGEIVRTSPGVLADWRRRSASPDRRLVLRAGLTSYRRFLRTLGANFATHLALEGLRAARRGFASSLEATLAEHDVPVLLHDLVLDECRRHLPLLGEILALQREWLGVETLDYHDLGASPGSGFVPELSIDEGLEVVQAALRPLGDEYAQGLERAREERWIDFLPREGKYPSGYTDGSAYDVHPYVLLNWRGDFGSLRSLAHELGHALHHELTRRHQAYPRAGISVLVSEVAAAVNEQLLLDHLYSQARTREERRFYLWQGLEELRAGVFRQAMLAEFERDVHAAAQAGRAWTGPALSSSFLGLCREFHGHAQGGCEVVELVGHEWATSSHFLDSFYVYQYAAAGLLAASWVHGMRQDPGRGEALLALLRSGRSAPPVALLRAAGLDPLRAETYAPGFARVRELLALARGLSVR